jgi:hypothetical protein
MHDLGAEGKSIRDFPFSISHFPFEPSREMPSMVADNEK